MRDYNDLKQAMKYAGLGCLVATGLAVTGCATTSATNEPARAATSTATPLPERPQPAAEPVDLDQQVRQDAPLRYVVKKGDTLWDIAGYYLNDPWYWPQLWYANPDIDNPHLIYPGDVLLLTRDASGAYQLRRAGTERLSPRIREQPLDDSIAAIPIDAIRPFLTGPRVVEEGELAEAPYIVSFIDERLIGGTGTTAFVRETVPTDTDDDIYSIVRSTGPFTDPETGEILGYQALPVGRLQITEYDDVSTARIINSTREALVGDRLLPVDDTDLVRDFYPHAPERALTGRIISVYDGVAVVGQYQVVTLSVGRRDGIERGHVLDIYQSGRVVRDPVRGGQVELPEVDAGQLMVFKAEEKLSFALIMSANRAVEMGDYVRTPRR